MNSAASASHMPPNPTFDDNATRAMLTPQGIVRTDEVAPGASITAQTGQKLNRVVIGVLTYFDVSFSAKIAIGLTVMAASLPFVAGWVGDQLQQSVSNALHALRVA